MRCIFPTELRWKPALSILTNRTDRHCVSLPLLWQEVIERAGYQSKNQQDKTTLSDFRSFYYTFRYLWHSSFIAYAANDNNKKEHYFQVFTFTRERTAFTCAPEIGIVFNLNKIYSTKFLLFFSVFFCVQLKNIC